MFDVPMDAWYCWLGVAAVGLVVAGVAVELPTTAPPDATGVAATVDAVAGATYPSTAEHPVDADAARLGPHRLGLRNDGGTAHARFAFAPVVPVGDGGPLARVATGAHPRQVFDSPAAFQRAADRRIASVGEDPRWRPVDGRIVVRQVHWEGVRVTLVVV
ncbi:DUF7283 family protein [Haloarchaeobius sp. DFWS5]|uniref:DUF7283 family protein n=1 Tax=Haloarchaeobius sp. DFWS5 TaxID=3446114 RepID=UPI003EC01A8F